MSGGTVSASLAASFDLEVIVPKVRDAANRTGITHPGAVSDGKPLTEDERGTLMLLANLIEETIDGLKAERSPAIRRGAYRSAADVARELARRLDRLGDRERVK